MFSPRGLTHLDGFLLLATLLHRSLHRRTGHGPALDCSVPLRHGEGEMIRKKNYPSIRKKLWGGALWSPSYFAGSCGGAPIEIIRQYIEQQQTPH